MLAGAPRFGGKLTLHGPETVSSVARCGSATVREATVVGLRKTTKTDSRWFKCKGTVVRPLAMV